MSDKKINFYNLTLFCEGSMPGFIVDEYTLTEFEQSFISEETVFFFTNMEDNSEVILRNDRLIGYKKSLINDECRDAIIKVNEREKTEV